MCACVLSPMQAKALGQHGCLKVIVLLSLLQSLLLQESHKSIPLLDNIQHLAQDSPFLCQLLLILQMVWERDRETEMYLVSFCKHVGGHWVAFIKLIGREANYFLFGAIMNPFMFMIIAPSTGLKGNVPKKMIKHLARRGLGVADWRQQLLTVICLLPTTQL